MNLCSKILILAVTGAASLASAKIAIPAQQVDTVYTRGEDTFVMRRFSFQRPRQLIGNCEENAGAGAVENSAGRTRLTCTVPVVDHNEFRDFDLNVDQVLAEGLQTGFPRFVGPEQQMNISLQVRSQDVALVLQGEGPQESSLLELAQYAGQYAVTSGYSMGYLFSSIDQVPARMKSIAIPTGEAIADYCGRTGLAGCGVALAAPVAIPSSGANQPIPPDLGNGGYTGPYDPNSPQECGRSGRAGCGGIPTPPPENLTPGECGRSGRAGCGGIPTPPPENLTPDECGRSGRAACGGNRRNGN